MTEDKKNKDRDVLENAKLCAEQGWKGNFRLFTGEVIEAAFITGTNWDKGFISIERVGERDKPPRILNLKDIESIEVGWN